MRDPRVDRLAELLVGYSLELKEGDLFKIEGGEAAAPLASALYRAALERGAHPYVNLKIEELAEILLAEGSDEQVTYVSPLSWKEVDEVDAIATLWSDTNTRSLSQADSGRHQRYLGARRDLSKRFWERHSAGEARWVGTQFPTHGHAQDAHMSLRQYEDFVYGACHVAGDEDPVAHWTEVSRRLTARAAELQTASELRILGADTDLKVVVAGRKWDAADGRLNLPDGEVYTSPVEDGTEGEIRFTFPANYNGREVEDVRLRFDGGRVVAAEAARGGDYLESLLDMDDGARILGEVAFGLNYEIDRFSNNILFDEKIGGTMHVALGFGFPELGGTNVSGLHWDMICDLRADGEVHVDGELVWKAGRFLRDPGP